MASSDPTPGAAYIRPSTRGPAPSSWTANAGNRAIGIPKTIALMSTQNVPCSTRLPRRNRRPSFTDSRSIPARSAVGGDGRMAAIVAKATRYVTTSIMYAPARPTPAISTPASAGPAS